MLEAAGRREHDHPRRLDIDGVRQVLEREDECPGVRLEHLAIDMEGHVADEHVSRLVLVVVDVERRLRRAGGEGLDEREPAADSTDVELDGEAAA